MRGPQPKDQQLFDPPALARISSAAADLRYLLSRGYAVRSALTLAGDHLQLVKRQRQLLFRCVTSPAVAQMVRARTISAEQVSGRLLLVDGHNVLITLETAIKGGPLVCSDDGFLRDLSELHGAYRENESTSRAITLLASTLSHLAPSSVELFLDRPIAFSGRLADRLRSELGPAASVSLADSADAALKLRLDAEPDAALASSDSVLLHRSSHCLDLVALAVRRDVPEAWILRLD